MHISYYRRTIVPYSAKKPSPISSQQSFESCRVAASVTSLGVRKLGTPLHYLYKKVPVKG